MKKVNISIYSQEDDGKFGKGIERLVTGKSYVKGSGRVDWTHLRTKFEIKTGAGELGKAGRTLLPHCHKVLFVPVPVVDNNGTLDPYKQEGFILDRTVFIDLLEGLGLIRYGKVSTAGTRVNAIQTYWNRKKNAPHSKKKFEALMDALYDNCDITLEDYLLTM